MNFVSVDVETANKRKASVCQIAIIEWENGKIIDEWSTLVKPKGKFFSEFTELHGIDEDKVKHSPTFEDIAQEVVERLSYKFVVSHSSFDKNVINAELREAGMGNLICRWVDTVAVARKAWPNERNHKLSTIADVLGIELDHHDALSDARACGYILIDGLEELRKYKIEDFASAPQGSNPNAELNMAVHINKKPLQDRIYSGKKVVITGKTYYSRGLLSDLLYANGMALQPDVFQDTTYVITGKKEIKGALSNTKITKANRLIEKGSPISILTDKELVRMMKTEKGYQEPISVKVKLWGYTFMRVIGTGLLVLGGLMVLFMVMALMFG